MEIWDLYSKDRIKTGETMIRGEKQPPDSFRLVIHVCIFNNKGEMLIQQRQTFKKGWSGLWDVTVGGHSVAGDSSQTAAERELFEELGIRLSLENVRPALTVNFDGGFDDVYLITKDIDITALKLQYEEVKDVRWADKAEIFRMLDEDSFIPYHQSFIDLLFYMRDHVGTHTKKDNTRPI